MNLSMILGLGARSVVGRVTFPLPPAFRDSFDTDGNLNGRPGWGVETRPASTGQINSMSAANGSGGGTTGSGAFALHTAAVEDVRVSVTLGVVGVVPLHHFANITATDGERDWYNVSFGQSVSGGINTGTINLARVLNGGSSTNVQITQSNRAEIGDRFTSEWSTSGADKIWTPFLNGRQINAAVTATVAGIDTSIKKHGLIGNTGARTFDDFQVADPALEQVLRLVQPNRTVALNSDGSVTWRLTVNYTQDEPTSLLASVYDISVSRVTPIGALTRVALSNFSAADGVAYGELTATAAQIASGGPFWVQVIDPNCRTAGGDTIDSVDFGPYQTSGYVIGTGGQSLAVSMSSQTVTTDTYTAPANTWWIDGAPTNSTTLGANHTRKQLPITSQTTAAAFAKGFNDATGARCTLIRGGVGGTNIATRTVGSASHNALLDALDHAGGRFHLVQWMDGQSDMITAPATYAATLDAIMDDLDTQNGAALPCLMHPVSSGWGSVAGSTDQNWQTVRRTQWALTQTEPSRYKLGAYSLDIQKTDNLHPTANGYGELARRCAFAAAAALGLEADARRGPSLFSVERIDAQTVYCVYDLEGADSISLINTGYASEFHGGMLFSTSSANNGSTITTKIFPTGATVDASPVDGKQGITFTFATNSFPSAVFAWAAYGKNPFNPNDNGTASDPINLVFATRASMIVGVRSGEPNVALQPRFATDGTDWLTDS